MGGTRAVVGSALSGTAVLATNMSGGAGVSAGTVGLGQCGIVTSGRTGQVKLSVTLLEGGAAVVGVSSSPADDTSTLNKTRSTRPTAS